MFADLPALPPFARRVCAALGLLLACGHALAADVVRWNRPASEIDQRRGYAEQLLIAVLERTRAEFGDYVIDYAPVHMERPRQLSEMKEGELLNVTSNPANPVWLRELTAIRIPLDLGLQSWRLALIHRKNQPRLHAVTGAADLKRLRAGANSVWVSAATLKDHGYTVVTGNNYEGLFTMLMADRFDYFPRGVNEIFPEFDARTRQHPDLAIDDGLLLYDAAASLFFVSPKAPRLAARIKAGMEAMLKDGSLERFLLEHHKPVLLRARLCQRRRIDVSVRPPDPVMAARKELWFDPFDPRHGLCPARTVGPR